MNVTGVFPEGAIFAGLEVSVGARCSAEFKP